VGESDDDRLLGALAEAAVRAADAGNGSEASRLTNAYIRLRRIVLKTRPR
jgi:hypothetical protein